MTNLYTNMQEQSIYIIMIMRGSVDLSGVVASSKNLKPHSKKQFRFLLPRFTPPCNYLQVGTRPSISALSKLSLQVPTWRNPPCTEQRALLKLMDAHRSHRLAITLCIVITSVTKDPFAISMCIILCLPYNIIVIVQLCIIGTEGTSKY